jgi:hypothetical protein
MNRIAVLGVTAIVAAGLVACEAPDATGPEAPSVAAQVVSPTGGAPAAARSVRRELKGQIDGSDVYGDACGDGQGILITSTGRGTVTHFGNAVMVTTSCVNLTDFSAIGETPYSLRAANGDEVGGLLTSIVFTSYGFDLYTSVTWGTGRFAGATGEIVWPTTSNGTGVWTSEVEGWISF